MRTSWMNSLRSASGMADAVGRKSRVLTRVDLDRRNPGIDAHLVEELDLTVVDVDEHGLLGA